MKIIFQPKSKSNYNHVYNYDVIVPEGTTVKEFVDATLQGIDRWGVFVVSDDIVDYKHDKLCNNFAANHDDKIIESITAEGNSETMDYLIVTEEEKPAPKRKKRDLTLNEYQEQAMSTCLPSCNNFSYMFTNLVGELGEFASKVAKAVRKEEIWIGGRGTGSESKMWVNPNNLPSEDFDKELKKEAGDILWQLAGLCNVMKWELEDVANTNLKKLASRKKRGVIDGDGDNR